MSTFSNLLAAINDRALKIMAFVAFLMTAVIGIVFLRTNNLDLLTGTNIADLVSAVPGITGKTPWHLSRFAGTVAYLLLSGSTIWGLLLSSKIVKETIPAALSLAMHNILSWLAFSFTGIHALVLLLDNYYTYTFSDLTIPFIRPYRPAWVGFGIVGFYMMVLVILSFQFPSRLDKSAGTNCITCLSQYLFWQLCTGLEQGRTAANRVC